MGGPAPLVRERFSATELRGVLGAFATGVTVITTRGHDHLYGMTANAFSSVSLDPPLVLVCVIAGTEGQRVISANGIFAVNVLCAEQEAVSRYFAARDRPRGLDAFRDVPHDSGVTGAPLIEGAAAYLDCRVHAEHEAGDHVIFLGEVLAVSVDDEAEPLIFHRGGYRGIRGAESS
jgi:flavin reductase (DIM6/NTAB) family NADH-FMN oxidoreductase RutF